MSAPKLKPVTTEKNSTEIVMQDASLDFGTKSIVSKTKNQILSMQILTQLT